MFTTLSVFWWVWHLCSYEHINVLQGDMIKRIASACWRLVYHQNTDTIYQTTWWTTDTIIGWTYIKQQPFYHVWYNSCKVNPEISLLSSLKVYNTKVNPGISAFGSDIEGLTHYVEELLKKAKDNVPGDRQERTPIYVMATAGTTS